MSSLCDPRFLLFNNLRRLPFQGWLFRQEETEVAESDFEPQNFE